MSYDVALMIDTGGDELREVVDVGNYTSNVSCMWALALGCRLRDLEGRNAGECIPQLAAAVAHMRDPANEAAYLEMEPDNGWGSHEGATQYLARILQACIENPKCVFWISS